MYVPYDEQIMRRTYDALSRLDWETTAGLIPDEVREQGKPESHVIMRVDDAHIVSLWALSSMLTDHGGDGDVIAQEYPVLSRLTSGEPNTEAKAKAFALYDEVNNFENQIWTASCVFLALRALEGGAYGQEFNYTWESILVLTNAEFGFDRHRFKSRILMLAREHKLSQNA
jgi:hypothetical protein